MIFTVGDQSIGDMVATNFSNSAETTWETGERVDGTEMGMQIHDVTASRIRKTSSFCLAVDCKDAEL